MHFKLRYNILSVSPRKKNVQPVAETANIAYWQLAINCSVTLVSQTCNKLLDALKAPESLASMQPAPLICMESCIWLALALS